VPTARSGRFGGGGNAIANIYAIAGTVSVQADLLRPPSFRGAGGLWPPFFAFKNADAERRLRNSRARNP